MQTLSTSAGIPARVQACAPLFLFLWILFLAIGCPCETVAGSEPVSLPTGTPAFVSLPGHPFIAVPSADGRQIFVSLSGPVSGVAVLQQSHRQWSVTRVQKYPVGIFGMALSHEGTLLIAVAADDNILFFDARKLAQLGDTAQALLGSLSAGKDAGVISACITQDDRMAFVSDEGAGAITVVDLDGVHAHLGIRNGDGRSGVSPAIIRGRIPVGIAPVGLAVSPDGATLYGTCEYAAASWGWPLVARPEVGGPASAPPSMPEGALLTISVARAETDPEHSIVARVPAGAAAVRVALSPDRRWLLVTNYVSNTLEIVDLSPR